MSQYFFPVKNVKNWFKKKVQIEYPFGSSCVMSVKIQLTCSRCRVTPTFCDIISLYASSIFCLIWAQVWCPPCCSHRKSCSHSSTLDAPNLLCISLKFLLCLNNVSFNCAWDEGGGKLRDWLSALMVNALRFGMRRGVKFNSLLQIRRMDLNLNLPYSHD